ncbi:hypothetical protein [Flavobacterium sp.]|uniref:hypothetical protein n=1 Tax=Flavobacterium sp. TaxID=239 RepID=UPI003D12F069
MKKKLILASISLVLSCNSADEINTTTKSYDTKSKALSVEEIRLNVIKTMDQLVPFKKPSPITNKRTVEEQGFIVYEHFTGIEEYCKKNNITLTLRNAGKHTISRIKNGNPCKGHDVLDKSIKERRTSYTYNIKDSEFEKLKGFIGHREKDDQSEIPELKKVWTVTNEEKSALVELNKTKNTKSLYTGDYDMHDLLKKNIRILANTPEELSTINQLTTAALFSDTERLKKTNNHLGRRHSSPYSTIRHGAQTNYLSYLIAHPGELKSVNDPELLPYENAVLNIDGKLLAITAKGSYILNSIEEVYNFYKSEGILQQIPPYYFFNYIRSKNALKNEIPIYTNYINKLLLK